MSLLSNVSEQLKGFKRWQQIVIGVGAVASVVITWKIIKFRGKKKEAEYYPNVPHFTAKPVVNCSNDLGECCIWDDRKQILCWIDYDKKEFWTYDPKTKAHKTYNLPEKPGSFALCENGSLLIAFASGPAFYDIDTGEMSKKLYEYEPNRKTRMNDGRCDRYGRFVVGGVMDFYVGATNPVTKFIYFFKNIYQWFYGKAAAIHRINEDLCYQILVNDVKCANSICFSVDGSIMYYIDSFTPKIRKMDYYSDRKIPDNDRIFSDKFKGFADGATVDSDDNIWSASFGIGKVSCMNAKGEVIAVVDVPEACPTCCTFGGENLNTLFITTWGKDFKNKKTEGYLYAVQLPNVTGCIENRFKGTAKQMKVLVED